MLLTGIGIGLIVGGFIGIILASFANAAHNRDNIIDRDRAWSDEENDVQR